MHATFRAMVMLIPALLGLFLPFAVQAQLISIKSVPVATVDQFAVFPSQNRAMGGLSIAADDPFLDPFINPAKGVHGAGLRFFSAPIFGSITEDRGSVRTLPMGLLVGSGNSFWGFSAALQQLGGAPRMQLPMGPNNLFESRSAAKKQYANNMYFSALIGRKLPHSDVSVGAGVFWAGLEAMEGVELLYARAQGIEQFGHVSDFRLGLYKQAEGQPAFEMVLVHNRVRMTHDVMYWEWFGDVATGDYAGGMRVERNQDYSNTWGLQLKSVRPLALSGAKAGLLFTVNRITHPKIPNYELMNIPRDPGVSWAFNFGGGFLASDKVSAFGVDLIYEPIWSNTWADAASPQVSRSGRLIPAGGKTVENDFRFSNVLARLGIYQQGRNLDFRLGLQVRFIHYILEQQNYVEETKRTQQEGWAEWTPSMGFSLKLPHAQVHYTVSLTLGTGQPGVGGGFATREAMALDSSFIVAPSGSLTLQEVFVITHQFSVAIPLR